MATVKQAVANGVLGSYQVGVFRLADTTELQAVVLVDTTGAAIASLPVSGTVAVSNFPATQPVSGTFFQAIQPVSGTFFQATQPVSGTFWQATQPVSGTVTANPGSATTGTFAAVSVSTNTALAASDATRVACSVYNTHATASLLVAYGFTSTSANYSVSIPPTGYLEIPFQFCKLAINGIASTGTITANVTRGT